MFAQYFCAIFKNLICFNWMNKFQQYNMLFTYHLKKVNNYPLKQRPHNALKHQHSRRAENHIFFFLSSTHGADRLQGDLR